MEILKKLTSLKINHFYCFQNFAKKKKKKNPTRHYNTSHQLSLSKSFEVPCMVLHKALHDSIHVFTHVSIVFMTFEPKNFMSRRANSFLLA
jgi:hypothetical protein